MTGYKSKRAMAQDSNWAWACNECGTQEFTSALSEIDLDYLACSNCGGDEFHKKALAQPAQKPVAWITPDGEGFRIRFSPPTNDVPLGWDALYAAPPQRTLVDLTDDEWFEWWRVSPIADETEAEIDFADFLIIAQAVVAKLKEKNNGA